MKRLFIFFFFFLFILRLATAHEHWLLPEKFYPHPGDTIKLYLASGHNFPESELKIAPNLIKEVKVIFPSGQKQKLNLNSDEKSWWIELKLKEKGAYQLYFLLSKPQLKKPLYLGKTMLFVGECPSRVQGLNLEQDIIELIPSTSPCELKKGGTFKIKLEKNGKPLPGTLQVIPEKGKSWYIQTDAQGEAEIFLKKAGKYLLIAEVSGQGCSFNFEVKEESNGK